MSQTRSFFSWCLFDFANNAFPTLIITFVFSTYFASSVAENKVIGAQLWGMIISTSMVLVAIFAPIFGAIIDQYQAKKKPLACFWIINLLSTAILFWIKPGVSMLFAGGMIVLANWSYEQTQVIYNGFLLNISTADKVGRYSGWGWACGYLGGLIALGLALLWLKSSGIDMESIMRIRVLPFAVVLWTVLWSLPFFLYTRDYSSVDQAWSKTFGHSLRTLWGTLSDLRSKPEMLKLLIARLFYMDALNTLFAFGGIYASSEFGFTMEQVLVFAIILNITAGIGAALLACLDDRWGAKTVICLSLLAISGLTCGLLWVHHAMWFWVLAPLLGLFVGPIQASSRSYLTRLTHATTLNQHFGLFGLSGRITAFIGPAVVSVVTGLTHNLRMGMAPIVIFFLVGWVILLWPFNGLGRSI